MNPSELIAIARALANGVIDGGVNPATQTELPRAISCTYYAMFHTLMMSNANTLIGASPADQQRWAWQQTYRSGRPPPNPEQAQFDQSRQQLFNNNSPIRSRLR